GRGTAAQKRKAQRRKSDQDCLPWDQRNCRDVRKKQKFWLCRPGQSQNTKRYFYLAGTCKRGCKRTESGRRDHGLWRKKKKPGGKDKRDYRSHRRSGDGHHLDCVRA